MNRRTTLISVLVGLLVVAAWWLFLFTPGQEEFAELEEQIAAAESEQVSLEQRILALEAVRARAPETEAAIAALRAVVPDDPALPSALRQLVAAAQDAGVEIDSVATARPTVVDVGIGLNSASVNLAVRGSYFQLVDFLRRIEEPSITARGIVFRNLTVAVAEPPELTITLSGEMFAALDPPPTPDDGAPLAPADSDDAGTDAAGEDDE